jgi:farnesyl-diphosphate farnesyltransferase
VSLLNELLTKTSRTFALAIPMLPEPTAQTVSLAYLLFRFADVFEDASLWNAQRRIEALEILVEVLEGREQLNVGPWLAAPPSQHVSELELIAAGPELFTALERLPAALQNDIKRHAVRTCEGMARTLSQADEAGAFVFSKASQLKEYCYIVAGIVGELLTDVFMHDCPRLATASEEITALARDFGEGLQLVNILKDTNSDAAHGRTYLPAQLPRAEVFKWARKSLDQGERYVQRIQHLGASDGIVAFTGISLLLASDSLRALERNEKLSRAFVLVTAQTLLERVAAKATFQVQACQAYRDAEWASLQAPLSALVM